MVAAIRIGDSSAPRHGLEASYAVGSMRYLVWHSGDTFFLGFDDKEIIVCDGRLSLCIRIVLNSSRVCVEIPVIVLGSTCFDSNDAADEDLFNTLKNLLEEGIVLAEG